MSSVLRWARAVAGRTKPSAFNRPFLIGPSNRSIVVSAASASASSTANSSPAHNLYHYEARTRDVPTKRNIEPLLQRLDEDVRKYGRLSRKDLDQVFEEIRRKSSVTSSQSLLVIRCCGSLVPEETPAERTKLVDEIWNIFSERRIPMDVSHYNALLRVYLDNEHNFSPETFLKDMESKGIEPNRVTYQRIMWRYCQKGDIEGASKILELMREKSMPLTENVLNALVLGHVRQNNLDGAVSVLTAMSAAGLSPSSETYAILMGGSARKGDLEKVKEILKDCESREIFLSDKDLMGVLEEFAIGGHPQHVNFILERMQKNPGYNQDAINLIFRLVNKKCENVALQVTKSLTKSFHQNNDLVPIYQSAFYVRHLVNANVSSEIVLSHCKELFDAGLAPKAYYIAIETAYQQGKTNLSLLLLKALHSMGDPIRQHYFWPIFITKYKQDGANGIFNVLNNSILEFELQPSVETLREYILPYVHNSDPKKTVEKLRENGVMVNNSVRGMIFYLLHEHKLKDAADVASTYGTKTPLKNLINPLVQAFLKTRDIESFIKIMTLAYTENGTLKNSQDENAENATDDSQFGREAVGRLINSYVNSRDCNELPDILQRLYANGLGITSEWASKIQQTIGDQISDEISELLSKLTSSDLKLVTYETNSIPAVRRTPEHLINMINNIESKGETATGLKKQLLSAYIRAKDVEKVEDLIVKLQESEFLITSGTKCSLLDMYTQIGMLDKATAIFNDLIEKEPDFVVDSAKILRLALLMIKEDKVDEAIKMLKQQKPNDGGEKSETFYQNTASWQIVNFFAEKGDVEKVKLMFDTLVENNYCEVSNLLLSSLVKVHAVNGDLKSALETFEKSCNEYRCTPWKNELSKKLIMNEDADGLQKLTDLSTIVHGEVNSLYDLVFVFIECGRLKQARKILETPGMRSRNMRFNSICERYSQEGKVEYLESLLEATRELSHIDRTEVFQQLLNNYILSKNVEKALGLWTILQEENIPPSDNFLLKLANFLKSNNVAVPFVTPELPKANRQTVKNDVSPRVHNRFSNFEEYFNNNEFEKATSATKQIIQREYKPSKSLLRYVLTKLSEKGQVQYFDEIGKLLTEQQKKDCLFNNKRCNAIINAGLTQGYLAEVEKTIDSSGNISSLDVSNIFPMGGILALLSVEGTYPKVLLIAEKFAKAEILSPINAVWMHNIMKNNHEEAKRIWDQYLSKADQISFRGILRHATDQKDINITEHLLGLVKSNPMATPKTIGSIRSCQLEILIDSNKLDEACNVLDTILDSELTLSDLSSVSLKKLKSAMENSGKEFKYKLPSKIA